MCGTVSGLNEDDNGACIPADLAIPSSIFRTTINIGNDYTMPSLFFLVHFSYIL